MSEKVYVFGNEGNAGSNNLLASILPALQNKGIDTGCLLGMLSNNNNGGLFGGRGFEDIIALIIVAAIFGNGNFGFGGFGGNNGSNVVASTAEREMLMSAIQRNGVDLSQLAQTIGCSNSRILDAIGQVSTQLCNFAGQNGLSFQQVINSIQSGNAAIASQIASCCCDIKQAIGQTNVALERGFSSVAYETQRQTCDIEKAIAASTSEILAGQRAAEMREMQDKIDALREKNAQQAVILNNAQQTATFSQMLAPIAGDLEKIKCRLPETVTLPYSCATAVPTNALYNNFGLGYGLGWSGWNNGCGCSNSLWG